MGLGLGINYKNVHQWGGEDTEQGTLPIVTPGNLGTSRPSVCAHLQSH